MKTKSLFIALTLSVFAFTSCQKAGLNPPLDSNASGSEASGKSNKSGFSATCESTYAVIITEERTEAGTLVVYNEPGGGFITVKYSCNPGWYLTETDLYAGDCDLIPIGYDGTPDVTLYPYRDQHNQVTSFSYSVPVSAIPVGTTGCISAHAVVGSDDGSGQVLSSWAAITTPIFSNSDQYQTSFKYYSCQ